MIEIIKECEGIYIAYNKKTGKTADIVRINGVYNAYGRPKVQYRVDFRGITRMSMVSLTEAKSFARKLVK